MSRISRVHIVTACFQFALQGWTIPSAGLKLVGIACLAIPLMTSRAFAQTYSNSFEVAGTWQEGEICSFGDYTNIVSGTWSALGNVSVTIDPTSDTGTCTIVRVAGLGSLNDPISVTFPVTISGNTAQGEGSSGDFVSFRWFSFLGDLSEDGASISGTFEIGEESSYYSGGCWGWFDIVASGSIDLLPTCPIRLAGLEVTQVVQDLYNSVPLVAGKETWVRAYVESSDATPVDIPKLVLRGTLPDGTERTIPITPGSYGVPTQAGPNAAQQRGKFEKSINVRLPDDWVGAGLLTLKLEVADSANDCLSCTEPAGPEGTAVDCTVGVNFDPTPDLNLRFVPIRWFVEDPASGDTLAVYDPPTLVDFLEANSRVIAMYPIAASDRRLEIADMATPMEIHLNKASSDADKDANEDYIFLKMATHRIAELGFTPSSQSYLGVLTGDSSPNNGFLSVLSASGEGTISTMSGWALFEKADQGYFDPAGNLIRNTVSHEIGHLLGLGHLINSGVQYCGSVDGSDEFPWVDSNKFVIGQPSLKESGIYGLDTHPSYFYWPTFPNVIQPDSHFELMSYCGDKFEWISDYTYKRIFNKLRLGTFSKATQTARLVQPAVSTPVMLVSGFVDQQGGVRFADFTSFTASMAPPQPAPGEYTLVLKAADGSILNQISFQPESQIIEGNSGGSRAVFVIPIAADPAIRSVNIIKNNVSIAEKTASANTPTITVTSPNGGEIVSGDSLTIQWNADDADGDVLHYDVEYSIDNGNTWETIGVGLSKKTMAVPLSSLKGTASGRIRVTATDGFNSGSDESDGVFTIPNNAPVCVIFNPAPGGLVSEGMTVVFRGAAIDREDGQLTGTKLVWRSTIDGQLGTGDNLEVLAGNLTEGQHTLSLTTSDAQGLVGFTNVTVIVSHGTDYDQDGVPDAQDNCPFVSNPGQEDYDGDGIGDACDPCIDKDGDGYHVVPLPAGAAVQTCPADCDDNNAAIHPGAAEVCNGIDDNCDGQIDEGVLQTFYRDADGDGFGDPAVSLLACAAPSGFVANNSDCDDTNAGVHPGAAEVCNGIDDNCDGQVDEGCPAGSDADGDGVSDNLDLCPGTPAGAIVNVHGCSIDQLVPCDGPASGGQWKSHGQYVKAVVKAANEFLKAKLITRKQWAEIVTHAAHSKCGWNGRWDRDGD